MKTERRTWHKLTVSHRAPHTAKHERAELKALGWDKEKIARYMKSWIVNIKVREIQDRLIELYLNSPRYCRLYGNFLKHTPIREGLPTISDMETYIYPQWVDTFKAILREKHEEV